MALFESIGNRDHHKPLAEPVAANLHLHKRYDHGYDVVVVALKGAEGMEVMLAYAERFPDTNIIWITDDPFFAGIALRNHI